MVTKMYTKINHDLEAQKVTRYEVLLFGTTSVH